MSRLPEVTIDTASRPAAGVGGGIDAGKAAGKEPTSPGTPSSVDAGRRSGKERRAEDGVPLPGWKLDALCQESCPSPAMRARFPYF